MRKPKIRSATVALMATLFLAVAAPRPALADGCPGIDYADEDYSILLLARLYQTERFQELDAALGCLMKDSRSLRSGKPSSALAYQMFRREMAGRGADGDDLKRIEHWSQQPPVSMFVEFAALRLRYGFAWNARGSASAAKVGDEQWRTFHQGLAGTEAALHRATPELRQTPLWHQLLLAVAGDTRLSRGNMATVFEEAIRRWPANYDLHEVMLSRLVPRWGGSWEQVDAFILHFANQRQGAEREALYARLYAISLLRGGDDPRSTRLDWARMKNGLESLVTLYPDPKHLNLAASFACLYQDEPSLKASLKRIPYDKVRPDAWLSGTDVLKCSA